MTTLPENRTIASLTKNEILKLPGFESFVKYSARKLKELVKNRVDIYALRSKKKTRGFTVGDYMKIYKKDTKLIRNTAVENLKKDINQIAENAKKAKEDFKEFEAENANGSHTTKDSGSHTTKDSGSHTKAKTTKEEVKKGISIEDENKRVQELLEEYRNKSPEELVEIARNATSHVELLAVTLRNQEIRQEEEAEREREWEANVEKWKERRLAEEAEKDRKWKEWEERVEKMRLQEQEEFNTKTDPLVMELREKLRNIIETYGKNSQEYDDEIEDIELNYGEEFLDDVLNQ